MNSGKTRTATVPQQPMRDSHSLNTVDNISSPRQCTRLVNCHELAGTCDTRQATEIKPAKNISQTDHLHSRPVCHHHGMSRTTLGNKDGREVSGLDQSPSLFIYYLFLQSSLVFFFRPLPPSSSTPPCFLLFFLTLYLRVCPLHNLLVIMTPGDSGVSFALFFSPQPSRSSREPIKVLRLSEHSGRVLVTMVTPYQITATGGRRRLCDVRMNQRRELTKRKSFAASQLLRAREVCTMSKVMNFRYSLLLISSLFFLSISPLETWGGEHRKERDMV